MGFAFALGILGFSAGFDTLQDWFLGPSFRQSIAVGAGKIVVLMFGLYFMVAFCIEFGGLGVRYLLAKTLGCLVAEPIPTDGSGAESVSAEKWSAEYGRQGDGSVGRHVGRNGGADLWPPSS